MILSFHPIIEADENIICAGRDPGPDDLAAIRQAQAVVLPQGCRESLYRMARNNCPHIFPNLDVRFDYPGKRGQIRLFRERQVAHPPSELYESIGHYQRSKPAFGLPAVIKLDWGGQGDTVFKASNPTELDQVLTRVEASEQTGQAGFLVQPFIPTRHRSLRVTVIGRRQYAYWRIMPDSTNFGVSVTAGARIDHAADPHLISAARRVTRDFCRQTRLQLAGFDFLFDIDRLQTGRVEPLMLEINYFFGRTGLGGSDAYYRILTEEVDAWLADLQLRRA